ncbi:secreted RxLR effector protein 161-like [Cicer arietinum]|uniref:secreted RxLR effector protein 161-like n=1 Tax=Cicer arietinum TaxID=3827 RepID=UPI003CC514C1
MKPDGQIAKYKARLVAKKFKDIMENEFEMIDLGTLSYFLEAWLILVREGNEELVDHTTFKQIVGSLRYLCNTRPYIAYSVGLVNRYMERPIQPHYMATKRILRYIKETNELGLLYPRNSNGDEAELVDFTDVDWWGDKDERKSTTGYVLMIHQSRGIQGNKA